MSRNRNLKWPLLIVGGVALIPAFVLGLWAYTALTAETIHPDPTAVPSAMHSAPPPKWMSAAEQGRQLVRASLTAQNLPGLSVAVGIAGDGGAGEIVWAEGFGWADLDNKSPVRPDTRFRLGTASTALTSAAVGLLLEKGRLKLDDEIQVYVPEFPRKEWPVTLQAAGRCTGAFCGKAASVRARNAVPLLQLWLDPAERRRRIRRRRAVSDLHAVADLRTARHG
jgi:CubicO group peptidase (beta-lactamase class C family)